MCEKDQGSACDYTIKACLGTLTCLMLVGFFCPPQDSPNDVPKMCHSRRGKSQHIFFKIYVIGKNTWTFVYKKAEITELFFLYENYEKNNNLFPSCFSQVIVQTIHLYAWRYSFTFLKNPFSIAFTVGLLIIHFMKYISYTGMTETIHGKNWYYIILFPNEFFGDFPHNIVHQWFSTNWVIQNLVIWYFINEKRRRDMSEAIIIKLFIFYYFPKFVREQYVSLPPYSAFWHDNLLI